MINKLNKLINETIKQVLLEITMEQAEARFNSKAFRKACNKINKSIDSTIQFIKQNQPADIPERFKPDALWWSIATFIRAVKNESDYSISDRGTKALETFFQIKEANKGSILSQPDLNKIMSWQELINVIEEASPAWEDHKQSKASKDWEAGSNLIYEDDSWQVFIPENKGAACKLGKGTDWCTAAPGLKYYEKYHRQKDPLIIFINKQDPEDKYQFHYGTEQFMNRYDEGINNSKLFYQLNEIVKDLADKLPSKVIKKASKYLYEALPDGGYKTANPEFIKYYNSDNELHREGGPAIEQSTGSKYWFQNNKRHREGGPAIEYSSGSKEWYLHGNLHREDGPAIERPSGYKVWYLNDEQLTEDEWKRAVQQMKQEKNLREHFRRYI